MPDLRDRCEAIGCEIDLLREEALLAGDELLPVLKEASRGKWRKVPNRAIEQGKRWQRTEPFALIEIVSTNGMRASLQEIEEAKGTR